MGGTKLFVTKAGHRFNGTKTYLWLRQKIFSMTLSLFVTEDECLFNNTKLCFAPHVECRFNDAEFATEA